MILMCISELVIVDEISIRNNSKCVHFLTHLKDSLTVPNDWNSVIYTSFYISKLLSKKNKIPKKCFQIIQPNKRITVTLSDGKSFDVIMFENDGFSGNVMFYFHRKDPRKTIIYTGPFVRYRSILHNEKFNECVLSGIDRLYIDNTRVNSTDNETIESVGKTIKDIATKYPGYQIFMNTPAFGFEDLIFSLVNDFKFKIFAGSLQTLIFKLHNLKNIFVNNMKDATIIILGGAPTTLEQIQHRFSQKKLTLRFIETDYAINYNVFDKFGLHQIHWSPHACLFQLYAFIEFVEPYKISRIFKDMPELPKFLLQLCRKKVILESDDVIQNSIRNMNADNNKSYERASEEYLTSQEKKNLLPRRNSIKRSKNQYSLVPINAIKPNNAAVMTPPNIVLPISSSESALNCSDSLDSDLSLTKGVNLSKSINPYLDDSIVIPWYSRNDVQGNALKNDNPEPVNEIELEELSDIREDVVESNSPASVDKPNSILRYLQTSPPSSPSSIISISSATTTSASLKKRRRINSKRKQIKTPRASKHSGKKQIESPRGLTNSRIKQIKSLPTTVNKRFNTKLFSKQKPAVIYSSSED